MKLFACAAAMAALVLLTGCDSSTDEGIDPALIEGTWAGEATVRLFGTDGTAKDGTISETYTFVVDGISISGTYASITLDAEGAVLDSESDRPVTGRFDADLRPQADFRIAVGIDGVGADEWEGCYLAERDMVELLVPDSPAPMPPVFARLERVED